MTVIANLLTRLGLESSSFTSGTRRVRRELSLTERAAGRAKTVISGLLAGISAGALVALAKRGLEFASSIGEVAQQVGVTSKTLQEYRYAGSQVGISNETMEKGFARLTKSIGLAATGSEKERKVFKALGIDVKDANGHVRDAGEIIPEIADALNRIPDPARRAAVETALFGKAGQQLDTLLAGGSGAINNLRDAAHKLGVVLSEEQIQKADETADKLDAMKQVLEASIAGAVSDNAGSILALVDALIKLAAWAGKATFAWKNFKLEQEAVGLQDELSGLNPGSWFMSPKRRMEKLQRIADIRGEQLELSRASEGKPQPNGGAQNGIWDWRTGGLVGADGKPLPRLPSAGSVDLDDLNAAGGRGDRPTLTSAQVGALLKERFGGTVTSTTGGKHEAGSLHYSNQAVDWVPRGGMGAVSKDQVRDYLISLGVDVRKVLGPGDKDHDDHFHVSFNKERMNAEDIADAREKSAEEEERQRKERLRQAYDAASEERRNQVEILRLQQDLTGDYVERTEIGRQLIDLETAQEKAALQLGVDLGEISKGTAEERGLQVDRIRDLKLQALAMEQEQLRLEDVAKLEEVRADISRERLEGELQLAETQKERRRIELEILAASYAEKKAALERAMAATRDDEEKERLRQQIEALGKSEAQAKEGVLRDTAGPLEGYLRSLPDTTAKMNEAIQGELVGGLQQANGELADLSVSWIKMGGIAGRVLKQILSGIMRILIARYITSAAASALDSFLGATSAGSGTSGASMGAPKDISSLPKFASGGSIRIPGMAGVDKNLLSLNGSPLAWVSRGENMRISPANDAGPAGVIVVHQTFAPNFAGNAATKDDMVHFAAIVKQDTIATMRDLSRRR